MKPTKSDNSTGKDNVDQNTPRMSAISDAEIRKLDWHQPASLSNTPTFFSHLKIYNGTFSDESIWRIFLEPFPFLLSPLVRIFDDCGRTHVDESSPRCGSYSYATSCQWYSSVCPRASCTSLCPGNSLMWTGQTWSRCAHPRSSPSSTTSTLLKLYVPLPFFSP